MKINLAFYTKNKDNPLIKEHLKKVSDKLNDLLLQRNALKFGLSTEIEENVTAFLEMAIEINNPCTGREMVSLIKAAGEKIKEEFCMEDIFYKILNITD